MRNVIAAALLFCTAMSAAKPAPAPRGVCGAQGRSLTRTTLYFGLASTAGNISENQWKDFLASTVTPRFPQGLTVWEAKGQWRSSDGSITRERAKVLLLVHEDTPAHRDAIHDLVEVYKRAYHQDSVLWESAKVCAAF